MKNVITLVFFVSMIVLSRLIPHPVNFTPLLAIALFCGSRFDNKVWAFALPIFGMALSDLIIGLHDTMAVVYLSLLPMVWLGSQWPKQRLLNSLFASVFFFAVTNFAVWWNGIVPYAPTFQGLVECYVMALPFFHNTLASTVIFLFALEWGELALRALNKRPNYSRNH